MPTLTVIQGPDHGKTFDLDGESLVIGRDPSCDIALMDPGVSRHHARLELRANHYVLKDAGSANGTFINGVRATESALETGDQIRLGNTILSMGLPPAEVAPVEHRGLPIRVDTEGKVDSSIMATAAAADEPHLAFAGGENLAEMRTSLVGLGALYRIAEMLARDYDIDRLLGGVMNMIFDVVDADRGFILLRDERTGAMAAKAIRYREELLEQIRREQAGADPHPTPIDGAGPQQPLITVSRTIINYVLARGEGVLSTNAMQDQRFEDGESVQDFGIRSAIAVPIKSRGETLGVIHVDTHVSQGRFTEDDLRLMTAIGCQTGLAVQNARLMASQVQQERLAAAGQAIASLSHYIKNLLQGIQGGSHAVETGLEKTDLDSVGKGWDIVRRNLTRIGSLVLDMLSYSRQAAPCLAKTSVNAILREVAELAQSAARERRVSLATNLDTTIPEIRVDADGLHHACLNIVTNAIEAAPTVTGKVQISTRLSQAAGEIVITVTDNGPGIPPEEQPKIFQAFYSTKGQKGTGLGLAAARKIVEEHGGRILVKSKPGEGASFLIRLPKR
ncbi:MAG: FHA domain-containing protein [Planctomycetes bacterium]|nr:FHA domain-containing protein [Planctomycetota bacterium]